MHVEWVTCYSQISKCLKPADENYWIVYVSLIANLHTTNVANKLLNSGKWLLLQNLTLQIWHYELISMFWCSNSDLRLFHLLICARISHSVNWTLWFKSHLSMRLVSVVELSSMIRIIIHLNWTIHLKFQFAYSLRRYSFSCELWIFINYLCTDRIVLHSMPYYYLIELHKQVNTTN